MRTLPTHSQRPAQVPRPSCLLCLCLWEFLRLRVLTSSRDVASHLLYFSLPAGLSSLSGGALSRGLSEPVSLYVSHRIYASFSLCPKSPLCANIFSFPLPRRSLSLYILCLPRFHIPISRYLFDSVSPSLCLFPRFAVYRSLSL